MDRPSAPPQEGLEIPPLHKLRLACRADDCFVGDLELTSKGGRVTRAPACPHCATPLEPLGGIDAPPRWDDIE